LQNTSKMMNSAGLVAQYKEHTEKMIEYIADELSR
jgi:hypothetical protein